MFICLFLWSLSAYSQKDRFLIQAGSNWYYHDRGQNLGTTWVNPNYSLTGWKQGQAVFGYGDDQVKTTLDFGADPTNKIITYYFRRTFFLSGITNFQSLIIGLLRDDGAAVFINGQQVILSNLPNEYSFNSLALNSVGGEEEQSYLQYSLNIDYLLEGINTIAVELHQGSSSSSDLIFDLTLGVSRSKPKTIIINEILADNHSAHMEPRFKQFSDAIELHNVSNKQIDISAYFLSDDPKNPEKWRIPNNTKIPSGGFKIFYADDLDSLDHTNFRLSASGETIGLYDWFAEEVDVVSYPELFPDVSFGKNPINIFESLVFAQPTIGSKNGLGYRDTLRAITPVFSHPGGKYSGPVTLSLTNPNSSGTIYYTRDGSDPTENSFTYSQSILLNQTAVVKARVIHEDQLPSEILTHTYLINENIGLPVVSIATNQDYLFDNAVGIYLDAEVATRKEWERPASFEYFEADGTRAVFSQIDVRLFGRGAIQFPEKSLAIFPRKTLGKNYIDYNFFPASEVSYFESLVLRSSSDDWRYTLFKDGMIQSVVQNQTSLDVQSFRQVILYLNGDYMGVHNIREKYNESYLASHHGIDPNGIDLLFIDNDYIPAVVEIKSGDAAVYKTLLSYVNNTDLSIEQNFEFVRSLIDVDNFIDYIAVEVITSNRSWRHNRRVWRPRTANGKFKWLLFDLDYGYSLVEGDILKQIAETDPLFKKLINNEVFLNQFIQRVALLEQTVFDKNRVIHFIDSLATHIDPQIERHLQKWGGTWEGMITSKADWLSKVQIGRSYAHNRPQLTEDYLRDFFGLGAMVRGKFEVESVGAGEIFMQSQLVTDDQFEGDFYNDQPISLQASNHAGYQFTGWTGAITSGSPEIQIPANADFEIQANFTKTANSAVLFAEILYQTTQAVGGEQAEFVELINISKSTQNISDYSISGAVSFTFPANTILKPFESVIVCKSASHYQALPIQVFQWTTGNLPDGGAELILSLSNGGLADQINYDDSNPWPNASSLDGASIEVINYSIGNQSPVNWGKSRNPGGTPGLRNSRYFDFIKMNEIVANPLSYGYLSSVDWIEISNTGDYEVDLGQLYLSDEASFPLKWQIPEGFSKQTLIKPGGFIVIIADNDAEKGPLHADFRLQGKSGSVSLSLAYPGFVTELDQITYPVQGDGNAYGRYPNGTGTWQLFTDQSPASVNHPNPSYIVAPQQIIAGDYMPVYVKVLNEDGSVDLEFEGSKTLVASGVSFDPPAIECKKGVGYVFTKVSASSDFELRINGLDDLCLVEVKQSLPPVILETSYNTDLTLISGVDYHIESDLTISRYGSLTIEPGARLLLGPEANIISHGKVDIQGTFNRPVVFMPAAIDQPWGGLWIKEQETQSHIDYAFFTHGGADDAHQFFHTETQAVVRTDQADLMLSNCYVFDNVGKAFGAEFTRVIIDQCLFATSAMGPELRNSYSEVTNSWIMDIPDADAIYDSNDADGIYFWKELSDRAEPSILKNSVIINVEDDGIDMLTCDAEISNVAFFNIHDKAASIGYGSVVNFDQCMVIDCNIGLSAGFASSVHVNRSTIHGTGRPFYNQLYGGTDVFNTILTGYTDELMRADEHAASPSFYYCLSNKQVLPGEHNILEGPKYNDANVLDFSLQSSSPAINAGDPLAESDPDGSRLDIGRFPYFGAEEKGLVINEIYYNPPDGQGIDEEYEFIELFNASGEAINLAGYSITGGVEFVFPRDASIEAGGFVLLAAEKDSYSYLACAVYQFDGGKLSNSGELLQLLDNQGSVLAAVNYSDQSPWPKTPDGLGFSLELDDPFQNSNDVANWRASFKIWGTPGVENSAPDLSAVSINEIMVKNEDFLLDEFGEYKPWFEIYNGGEQSINIGGWSLREEQSGNSYQIPMVDPETTEIPAKSYLVVYLDDDVQKGVLHVPLELNPIGGSLSLNLPDETGVGLVLIDELAYTSGEIYTSIGRYPDGSANLEVFEYPSPGHSNFGLSKYLISPAKYLKGESIPLITRLSGQNYPHPEMQSGLQNLSIRQGESVDSDDLILNQGFAFKMVDAQEDQAVTFGFGDDSIKVDYAGYRSVHLKSEKIYRNATWTSDQDYHVVSTVVVPSTATLTIAAGTRVYFSQYANLYIEGKLVIEGTKDNPVVFAPIDPEQSWGGIYFQNLGKGSEINHCFLLKGGSGEPNDIGRFPGQAVIESKGDLSLSHVYVIGGPGKGLHISNSHLQMDNCIFYDLPSGIELENSSAEISNSYLNKIYGSTAHSVVSNGLLAYGGANFIDKKIVLNQLFMSSIIGNGIVIENGMPTELSRSFLNTISLAGIKTNITDLLVNHCAISETSTGMRLSGASQPSLDHLSFHSVDVGVHITSIVGSGSPQVSIRNSIFSSLGKDIDNSGTETPVIQYTLSTSLTHPGTGNLQGNPAFVNAQQQDFRLKSGSIAINAGDPSYATDADGSRTDMGVYEFEVLNTSNYDLVVSEILYKPENGTPAFIELYNPNGITVNLFDYQVSGSVLANFSNQHFIAPNGFLVLTASPSYFISQGITSVVKWDSGILPEMNGSIEIRTPSAQLVDQVMYNDGSIWSVWADGVGTSLELSDLEADNDESAVWRTSYYIGGTPGRINSIAPVEELFINEFVARSGSLFPDENGVVSDWIELYNGSDHMLNLNGLMVTRDPQVTDMHVLKAEDKDDLFVTPGGFLVLRADENAAAGSLHLNFVLSGSAGTIQILLTKNGSVELLDEISYGTQRTDVSYGRIQDGSLIWQLFEKPTPGQSNNIEIENITGLYINEFMARNSSVYLNNVGQYDDWIELYNDSDQPINIGGLFISDQSTRLDLYQMPTTFPDSTTIPAKGFLMLFPSGKPSLGIQHLDFQLGGSGESITISQEVYGNYTIIDAIEYPSQTINISYGRVRDGQLPWIFFEQPTPRASNDGSNSAGHSLVDQSFVSLYPNPSQGAINIQFYTYEPMEVEIQLYSGTGQLLQVQGAGKQHITGDGSIITLNLNPDYYHPGVYIVGILMKNELLTKRIFLTH